MGPINHQSWFRNEEKISSFYYNTHQHLVCLMKELVGFIPKWGRKRGRVQDISKAQGSDEERVADNI